MDVAIFIELRSTAHPARMVGSEFPSILSLAGRVAAVVNPLGQWQAAFFGTRFGKLSGVGVQRSASGQMWDLGQLREHLLLEHGWIGLHLWVTQSNVALLTTSRAVQCASSAVFNEQCTW